MNSYTPITLPYFAPADSLPGPLPTQEEVLAATDLLAPPIAGKDILVVRVGQHFVAKYGRDVRTIEGENMIFVKQHTTIPIAQVYALYTFDESRSMIIMEFIPGLSLDYCIQSMEPERLEAVRKKLEAQVAELRRIPAPPNYYGSIGQRPLVDLVRDCKVGPFDNSSDFAKSFVGLRFPPLSGQRFDDFRKEFSTRLDDVSTALGHSQPVFTHNDLYPGNVIVRPDDTPLIIDYELAGFYPAYQERITTDMMMELDDCEFEFLEESFPDEQKVISDAEKAFVKALREEMIESDAQSAPEAESPSEGGGCEEVNNETN
ncbi:kinase-like domain-containing protein [Nemania abortiva]|nr:kinase-like domain-containing protein [Nemania abortiva]